MQAHSTAAAAALVTPELRRWIREATGVQITDENAAPVALALRIQAERLRLDPALLRQRIIEGSVGAQDFIDEVTTHESYFFRAREQMQLVVEQIIPERLRRAPGRRVRVLSLPCARGEEPYSLAILLEEAGIPPEVVEIIGGDIAHSCIESARSGGYSALALRRTDPNRARRWFRRGAEQDLQLDQGILRRVDFRRINLLRDAERLLHGPFDVVFCENLLIYFDAANVARALGVIERLLAEDGWLFVDHAEWNLPRARFEMQELQGRVGFRPRQGAVDAAAEPWIPKPSPAPAPEPVPRASAGPAASSGPALHAQAPPTRPPQVTAKSLQPDHQRLPGAGCPTSRTSAPVRSQAARPAPARASARTSASVQAGWQRALESAQAQYEQKRFTEALLGFEELLRLHPELPPALLGKARVLADCGEDFEAMEVLEALVTTDMEQGQESAQEQARRRTMDDAIRIDALGLMAVLLHKKGLGDLAAQYLRRLAMLDPNHVSLALLTRRTHG